MSNISFCPHCHSNRYTVTNIILLDDNHYQKILQCRRCQRKWENSLSLLSSSNQYTLLWLPSSKQAISLHRWVWEQKYNCKLTPTDAIHHLNHNKGDNRICNLEKMDRYSHNGSFHITAISCNKCEHIWLPKSYQPRICPKCKSPYWDRERKRK